MALEDYRIPLTPLDIAGPLDRIRERYRKRDESNRADEELRIKRDKLRNDERRLNNEEFRRQREFDLTIKDRKKKARDSAIEFLKKGDRSTAAMIARDEGIDLTPEMGAPTVYTPAMALANADKEAGAQQAAQPPTGDTVKLEPSAPSAPQAVTPMNVFARQQSGTGVSVPEEPQGAVPMQPTGYQPGQGMQAFGDQERQVAADNLSTVGTGLQGERPQMMEPQVMQPEPRPQAAAPIGHGEAGHAIEDLMGIMQEPIPSGAVRFNGPGGVFLGRYDPEEERKFRAERAQRVTAALGPVGEQFAVVAELVAKGDITEAQGKVLMSTIGAEASMRAKEAGKDRRQEDQQVHQALLAKLYRNEALTVQDRYNFARISASAKVTAAGGGPITPEEAELVRLMKAGAGEDEIATRASEMGRKADIKHVTPLTQNVVNNAAKGQRAQEKLAGLEMNDIDGKFVGYAHNTTQANIYKKQTDQFGQAAIRLQELIDDIKKDGSRVNPLSIQEIQDRLSKAESVNAAMRVYNGLGATDASQRLEARITGAIGTPGHGWLMGANLGVIERILHEAKQQHTTRLNTSKRTGPSADRPLAPALGGLKPGESGSTSSSGPAAPGHWIPVPARVADQFPGKTEVFVDTASGRVTDSR